MTYVPIFITTSILGILRTTWNSDVICQEMSLDINLWAQTFFIIVLEILRFKDKDTT